MKRVRVMPTNCGNCLALLAVSLTYLPIVDGETVYEFDSPDSLRDIIV